MKKKSFLKIGGAMLLLALVLNIQYAWGGDGVKDHPLHLEVLAQSNDSISTGGDAGKGAGTDTGVLWTEISEDCFVIVTGAADTVTAFGLQFKVEADGYGILSVSNASTRCKPGGDKQCSSSPCGEFWIEYVKADGAAASIKEEQKRTEIGDMVSIPITDMETDYGKLSDFAEDIKMIPLEFKDECILGEIRKVVMSDSDIFIMERNNPKGVYVFDHMGKYLYKIGNRGQEPEEFVDLSDFSLNEEERVVYLYDLMRTKVLAFSYEGDFIKDIPMNYYADNFEYQNGLFYLYQENVVHGDPLYSLVIKDDKGKTVNKYYPVIEKLSKTNYCVFRKLDNEILFAEDLRDSIFTIRGDELTPKYFIDYKAKSMSKVDRESILKRTRLPLTVLLECKKMAGIKDIFEINDKVFIKNKHIVIPQFTVYDKKTQKVKTFSHILNDFLFIGLSHPIGQYKDYLISVGPQERLQAAINIGFKVWQEEGLLTAKRAKELTAMIEERFPDRNNIGETNPMIFLLKVKK